MTSPLDLYNSRSERTQEYSCVLTSLEFRNHIILFLLCCLTVKFEAFFESLYRVQNDFFLFSCSHMHDGVYKSAPSASTRHWMSMLPAQCPGILGL